MQQYTRKRPPLGSGQRFAQLKGQLANRPGVTDPGALAAAIGRKKYGNDRFAQLGQKKKRKKAPPQFMQGP